MSSSSQSLCVLRINMLLDITSLHTFRNTLTISRLASDSSRRIKRRALKPISRSVPSAPQALRGRLDCRHPYRSRSMRLSSGFCLSSALLDVMSSLHQIALPVFQTPSSSSLLPLTAAALYNVTAPTKAATGNELGIFEGLGDYLSQTDLDLFYLTMAP